MKTTSPIVKEVLKKKGDLDSFLYTVGLSFGIFLFVIGIPIMIIGFIWMARFDFGSLFPKE